MDKRFLDVSELASKYRACVENGISDNITRRLIDIYAEKTNRINLLHDLADYDAASVAPAMILHLGKNAINRSNEDFNSFYRWASSILGKFSNFFDAQHFRSVDPCLFRSYARRRSDDLDLKMVKSQRWLC